MSTIRSNPFPPQPQPQHSAGSDAGRLAAQKAFFALVGQGQPSAVAAQPNVPQAAAVAPTARAAAPADPQKIPRPGSLFDIRV